LKITISAQDLKELATILERCVDWNDIAGLLMELAELALEDQVDEDG